MIKKGFDWFRVYYPNYIHRAFDCIEEPTACEVCKGCFYPIGRYVCKFSQALLNEVSHNTE